MGRRRVVTPGHKLKGLNVSIRFLFFFFIQERYSEHNASDIFRIIIIFYCSAEQNQYDITSITVHVELYPRHRVFRDRTYTQFIPHTTCTLVIWLRRTHWTRLKILGHCVFCSFFRYTLVR